MFDKDITIINKYYELEPVESETPSQLNESETRDTQSNETTYRKVMKYSIAHIKGFWSSNESISINGVDLVGSKRTIVRILYNEPNYVEPSSFSGSGWTLKNDDYVVKGIVEEESITTITTILDSYECLKITNVAVKDYGSSDMWHFEIEGE